MAFKKAWWERDRYRHLSRNGALPRAAIAFIVPVTSISPTSRASSPNRYQYLGVTATDRLFPAQGNFKREMTDPFGFRPIDAGKIVPDPIENLTE